MRYLVAIAIAVATFTGCMHPGDSPPTAFDDAQWTSRIRNVKPLPLNAGATPATVAPAKLELSLEQCRAIALKNNLEVEVQLINPETSRLNVSTAEAKFDTTFFASTNYTKSDPPNPTGIGGLKSESTSASAGVTVPLRTGGSLSLSMPLSRTDPDGGTPSTSADLEFSFSHPLLQGAGKRSAEYGIRIAKLDTHLTDVQVRVLSLGVLARVEQSYWELVSIRKRQEVLEKELALAKKLLDRAKRRVAEGEGAELDVMRAESGVADRAESIIEYRNSHWNQQRILKRLLNKPGLAIDSRTEIIPSTKSRLHQVKVDSKRLRKVAFEERPELLTAELDLIRNANSIELNRNNILPLLSLDYTYGVGGAGHTFKDSFDEFGRFENGSHSVGLSLNYTFGNVSARNALKAAMLSREQILLSRDRQKEQITIDLANAIDRLTTSWNKILAARRRTVLATRVLRGEERQFNQGQRTSTDVLDAQTKLSSAQFSEITAVTDYQNAIVDLAVATGTVTGKARVRWRKDK